MKEYNTKTFHILNGDVLKNQLSQTKIIKDFIVFRESLIDGNVASNNLADFWTIRAKYISETHNISTEEYFSKTVSEFEKLYSVPNYSEVCLWFENDLFCQANMWFVISILANYPTYKIYRVFPVIENTSDTWQGFGIANEEKLQLAFNSKILFNEGDIELGKKLWTAYQNGNLDKLKNLAKSQSNCFEYLEEVCQAHIERFTSDQSYGKPEKAVKEIVETQSKDFQIIFSEFSKRHGIYGFGDIQLKSIYNKLIKNL